MAKGLSITITRRVETRDPYPGERWPNVWNGVKWIAMGFRPKSLRLAWIYGTETKVHTTRLEFRARGEVTREQVRYWLVTVPKLRRAGLIK